MTVVAWVALGVAAGAALAVAAVIHVMLRPPDPLPPAVRQAIVLEPPQHGSLIILQQGDVPLPAAELLRLGQSITTAVGHKQFVLLALTPGGAVQLYGRDEVVDALRRLADEATRSVT